MANNLKKLIPLFVVVKTISFKLQENGLSESIFFLDTKLRNNPKNNFFLRQYINNF